MIDNFCENPIKASNAYSKFKVQCKNCGHKHVMPVQLDRTICDWCGRWIYRTPHLEFKYKMEEQLKKWK